MHAPTQHLLLENKVFNFSFSLFWREMIWLCMTGERVLGDVVGHSLLFLANVTLTYHVMISHFHNFLKVCLQTADNMSPQEVNSCGTYRQITILNCPFQRCNSSLAVYQTLLTYYLLDKYRLY